MARTISASVGRMGGVNRPPDVKTVQELLNQVPVSDGGPRTPLIENGLCGQDTIDAIQKFQLHHFGWRGADGRVDPGGPTLRKLNEYDGPRLRTLMIRNVVMMGVFLKLERHADWFFEVWDAADPADRVTYRLRTEYEPALVAPTVFLGQTVDFQTSLPHDGLATRGAMYQTRYHAYDPADGSNRRKPSVSTLSLHYGGEPVIWGDNSRHRNPWTGVVSGSIVYPAHIEPPPISPEYEWERPVLYRSKMGSFELVRPSSKFTVSRGAAGLPLTRTIPLPIHLA